MSLKKYTEHTQESFKESMKDIVKEDIKLIKPTPKQEVVKEEVLLTPKVNTNNTDIEILEEKILKFNNGVLKDILETLKTKYSDTDYFIRKKDNEVHIVKYNENLKLNLNEFVNSLLKFYFMNPKSKRIVEGIKIKGNSKFSIIENMRNEFSNKFIDDLTGLLAKKNKEE
jgi:hypothetical protein